MSALQDLKSYLWRKYMNVNDVMLEWCMMFFIQHIQFGVLIYPINLKVLEWSHQAQAAKLSQDVQMSDESCMYKCAHFTTCNCHLFKMQTVNSLNCQQFLTHFFRKADHTLSTKIAAIAIGTPPPQLALLGALWFQSLLQLYNYLEVPWQSPSCQHHLQHRNTPKI